MDAVLSGMSSDGRTVSDRVVEVLDALEGTYDAAEERVRAYSPYVVRTVEAVLAAALLVFLLRWLYTFWMV